MKAEDFIPTSVPYVSGRTRLFGIVGHPIEQVRSPEFVTAELSRRGHDAVLVPIHLPDDRFEELMPAIMAIGNLDGLIITIPYKARAARFADDLGPQAQVTGTVSVMAKTRAGWRGEMFDGIGCAAAIRRRNVAIAGSRIGLYGAGGAGSAIALALASGNPRSLTIHDPDSARCKMLTSQLAKAFPRLALTAAIPNPDEIDILINASPVGMLDPAASVVAGERLPSRLAVMDIVMAPDRTRLLRIAEDSGCIAIYGREMLGSQIEAVTDYLTENRPSESAIVA
ncbi:shikimate dehydrogenase family protein [Afipia sp. TerB]